MLSTLLGGVLFWCPWLIKNHRWIVEIVDGDSSGVRESLVNSVIVPDARHISLAVEALILGGMKAFCWSEKNPVSFETEADFFSLHKFSLSLSGCILGVLKECEWLVYTLHLGSRKWWDFSKKVSYHTYRHFP